MLIDFNQKSDSVELSYVAPNGSIEIENIYLDKESGKGFYDIVTTSEDDVDKIPNITSFRDLPLKKVPAKFFKGLCVNDFLSRTLAEDYPDVYQKIRLLKEPNLYSIDIETEITEQYGYSSPEKAENRILSISITDEKLDTILFIVKNPEFPLTDFDTKHRGYVESILRNSLEDFYGQGGERNNREIEYNIKEFDTEYEMLSTFILMINKYFHVQIGWNVYKYDWLYIKNRCSILGIDVAKASPVKALAPVKKSVNGALEIPVEYPRHRLLVDYMMVIKKSIMYNNFDSYSLNNCADIFLGLQKVSYTGNLNTLYHDDYLKFIAYAFVDTILVMLIHKKTNIISQYFFQSYYTELPYLRLNQNPISLALIYQELRLKNKFMVPSEFIKYKGRKYDGAFVKQPTKHIADALMGLDFGSLYPNSMISYCLSPETKIDDTITVDDYGNPVNEYNRQKMEKYVREGFCVTPLGRIYRRDPNNLVTSIEKRLLAERKKYKKVKSDIYLNILSKIDKEIQKRNL